MTDLQVRRVRTPLEFEQFRSLAVEYENSLDPDLRHSGFAAELADLHRSYGEPSAAFVAFSGGEPCGCVAFCRMDSSNGIVKKLYVSPRHRGSGAARALMLALLDFARDCGYSRIVLDTERERLPAAYKLYVTLGFLECAPYGDVNYATPTFMEMKIL